jgi:hypothetical protein
MVLFSWVSSLSKTNLLWLVLFLMLIGLDVWVIESQPVVLLCSLVQILYHGMLVNRGLCHG